MNCFKLESQDGKLIGYCKWLGIGQRKENKVIGDKLKVILNDNKMSSDELIKVLGSSYRDTVNRVLNNEEIPKVKFVEKLIEIFKLDKDYFKDKELENVIVTDNNMIVGEFSTNEKAFEVYTELKKMIISDKNYIKVPTEKGV